MSSEGLPGANPRPQLWSAGTPHGVDWLRQSEWTRLGGGPSLTSVTPVRQEQVAIQRALKKQGKPTCERPWLGSQTSAGTSAACYTEVGFQQASGLP